MRISPAGTNAGYSLAELLVVLAIVSMVVAITPTFYRMAVPSAEFSRSATELVAYLRDARLAAMRGGKAVALKVEPGSINGVLANIGEFVGPGDAELIFKPEFSGPADEDTPLVFYPEGGSTGGTLTLSGEDRSREISVNWLTGHIRLVR